MTGDKIQQLQFEVGPLLETIGQLHTGNNLNVEIQKWGRFDINIIFRSDNTIISNLGYINGVLDCHGYNPQYFKSAEPGVLIEKSVHRWMNDVESGIYNKKRCSEFVNIIKNELMETVFHPTNLHTIWN